MTLRTGNWVAVRRNTNSRRRAFTLIELILVMAMLMVVLAISSSSLSKFFHGRILDSEARRFVSLTRYGQSRAVSEGIPMVLWIDAKQRMYGLHQEPGYTDNDSKEVEYVLGENLSIDTEQPAQQMGQSAQARQAARGLPMLRFLPDGFISELSVPTVIIRELEGDGVLIAQTLNGLNYEISTNAWRNNIRR